MSTRVIRRSALLAACAAIYCSTPAAAAPTTTLVPVQGVPRECTDREIGECIRALERACPCRWKSGSLQCQGFDDSDYLLGHIDPYAVCTAKCVPCDTRGYPADPVIRIDGDNGGVIPQS